MSGIRIANPCTFAFTIKLMNNFSDTERKVLASGIELRYLPDEYLFRQGQKAEFVFYLQEGSLVLEGTTGFVSIDRKGIFIGIEEAIEEKKHVYTAMTSNYAQFLVFERKYFQLLIDEFDLALPYFESKKAEFNELLNTVQPNYATI
jgi:CRP-like cAMP-binding protein